MKARVSQVVASLAHAGLLTHRSLQPRPFLNLAVHARCGVPNSFLRPKG